LYKTYVILSVEEQPMPVIRSRLWMPPAKPSRITVSSVIFMGLMIFQSTLNLNHWLASISMTISARFIWVMTCYIEPQLSPIHTHSHQQHRDLTGCGRILCNIPMILVITH